MLTQLFKKKKDLHLERSYPSPIETVWAAWTEADALRRWWGPEHTTVPECECDPRVGGRIYIVTEAGEGMGKYQGTRWPMEGTFSVVEPSRRLVYEARSWTAGEEATSTIRHVNELTLVTSAEGTTDVSLHIAITEIGSKAKMAAFGMKMGYKAQLDNLERHLADQG